MASETSSGTIRISGGGEPGKPPGHPSPKLVLVEGMHPGLSVALDREATTIGRSSENDFVLDSAAVSKNHARVLRENGVFYVEDMGSTNGLRVNGRPLAPQERRVLCHGDSIELANHVILFCHHGTFSDRTGLSSIQVDRDHVRHAADKLLAEVPGIKRPAT